MKITRKSLITKLVHTLDLPVTPEQMAAYEAGASLQDAFPQLPAPEREFIKTGITPEEWKKHVGDPDDEDDEPVEDQPHAHNPEDMAQEAGVAPDDHQRLIDQVFGYVRDQLADGGLEFTVLTINENGHRNRLRIDPRFMESGNTKDALTDKLRQEFREQGIVRYVLVAECWMDRRLPVPPGPMTRDGLDQWLAEYAREYERRGLSPDHGGGRDEIILMHVCDRKRSTFRFWTIDRDPITGAVRDLIAFDGGGSGVALTGRFVNLLEGEAN